MAGQEFVIHADGGARGNPGPAAYGTVVHVGGELRAEAYEYLGETTNNVAEYSGMIAGLEIVRALAGPAAHGARVLVRLDSKLVVEQMSGRWKIKNAVMRELALRARDVAAGLQVAFEWIPRAENSAADALVNEALDLAATGVVDPVRRFHPDGSAPAFPADEPVAVQGDLLASVEPARVEPARAEPATLAAEPDLGPATRLILVRHGEAAAGAGAFPRPHGAGEGPPLSDAGRAEAAAQATRLEQLGLEDALVVTSPALRCSETAAVIAHALGTRPTADEALVECDFGSWAGLTASDVATEHAEDYALWLRDAAAAPHGGESFADLVDRAHELAVRLRGQHPGQVVVLVTHAALIAALIADALGVDAAAVFRLQPSTGSAGEVNWYADGGSSVVEFGARPA